MLSYIKEITMKVATFNREKFATFWHPLKGIEQFLVLSIKGINRAIHLPIPGGGLGGGVEMSGYEVCWQGAKLFSLEQDAACQVHGLALPLMTDKLPW